MIFHKHDKKYFHNFWIGLLFLFLFVFPKGGIKIHDIPITWGYILLAIISLFILIRRIKKFRNRKEKKWSLLKIYRKTFDLDFQYNQ